MIVVLYYYRVISVDKNREAPPPIPTTHYYDSKRSQNRENYRMIGQPPLKLTRMSHQRI